MIAAAFMWISHDASIIKHDNQAIERDDRGDWCIGCAVQNLKRRGVCPLSPLKGM